MFAGGHARMFALLLAAPLLAGCIGHTAALRPDRTAVIPGRATVGLDTAGATTKVLHESAKLTVAHGFRYFSIIGTSRQSQTRGTGTLSPERRSLAEPKSDSVIVPGMDVTIRILKTGGIAKAGSAGSAKTWDAYEILSPGKSDPTLAKR